MKKYPDNINIVYHCSPRIVHRDSIANYIRALILNSSNRPICYWGPDDSTGEFDLPIPSNVSYKAVFTRTKRRLLIPPTFQLISQFNNAFKNVKKPGFFWFHVWDYSWKAIINSSNCNILTIHGNANDNALRFGKYTLKYFYHTFARNVFIKRANLVIAVSKDALSNIQNFVNQQEKDKIKYFPTFVDTAIFKPNEEIRNKSRKCENWPIVLFTGRLSKEKGLDKAITAFQYFTNIFPNAVFRIVGSGEMLDTLKEQARDIKNVLFVGSVPHPQIVTEYQNADILLLLSEREGLPLTLLESLACGTPVVTSGVGGISEVVMDEVNGFIVNSNNPMQVAEKMVGVIERGNTLRMPSVDSILPFSQEKIVPKIWNAIDELLDRY